MRELAARSGKHASQLSRVERPEARSGQPKPATIQSLLEALGASPEEREAVFHKELPALTQEEIGRKVAETEANYESVSTAFILIDEHWNRWYMNRAARALLALSQQKYEETLGSNGLVQLINPASPLYERYPEPIRREMFSMWAATFCFHFARQQFDKWYLEIEHEISKIYWAHQIWISPPFVPEFADSLIMTIEHPQEGTLRLRAQLNQMLRTPRFAMAELTAADEETAPKVQRILHKAGLDKGHQ